MVLDLYGQGGTGIARGTRPLKPQARHAQLHADDSAIYPSSTRTNLLVCRITIMVERFPSVAR